MTTVQRISLVFGWGFIIVAIAGFIVSGGSLIADPWIAPRAFNLFPVNLIHNLLHLAFGIWGVVAARRWAAARTYALVTGIAYLGLTALGFLAPTLFGLAPIGGNDIWLHALIGIVLTVAGATANAPGTARTV